MIELTFIKFYIPNVDEIILNSVKIKSFSKIFTLTNQNQHLNRLEHKCL